jgi:hypothetical protein
MTVMDLADLRARLAACGSLASAIRVGLAAAPAWTVVDVVVQDEYTHDVIMQGAPDGPAIVLDCT